MNETRTIQCDGTELAAVLANYRSDGWVVVMVASLCPGSFEVTLARDTKEGNGS